MNSSQILRNLVLAFYNQHKKDTRHDCMKDIFSRGYHICDVCMYLEPIMKEFEKQSHEPENAKVRNEI